MHCCNRSSFWFLSTWVKLKSQTEQDQLNNEVSKTASFSRPWCCEQIHCRVEAATMFSAAKARGCKKLARYPVSCKHSPRIFLSAIAQATHPVPLLFWQTFYVAIIFACIFFNIFKICMFKYDRLQDVGDHVSKQSSVLRRSLWYFFRISLKPCYLIYLDNLVR